MAIVDLVMPKLGESIMEATILKWHKKPGDAVASDETILDIATDKVDSEVPSTASGVIAELLYKENDVVPIGAAIARINTNGEASKIRLRKMKRNPKKRYKFRMRHSRNRRFRQLPAASTVFILRLY